MMRKIKQDDQVIILTGKYKGHKGRILRVVDSGKKVVVEGINMVKKHVKPNPQRQQTGGVISKEAPLDISNVAIVNPASQKGDRVGFKMVDGKKRRFFKSNGELVDI